MSLCAHKLLSQTIGMFFYCWHCVNFSLRKECAQTLKLRKAKTIICTCGKSINGNKLSVRHPFWNSDTQTSMGTNLLTNLFIHWLDHSLTHFLIHLLTDSLACSFIHLLTHSQNSRYTHKQCVQNVTFFWKALWLDPSSVVTLGSIVALPLEGTAAPSWTRPWSLINR